MGLTPNRKIEELARVTYLTEEETNAEQQRMARAAFAEGNKEHPLRSSMSKHV